MAYDPSFMASFGSISFSNVGGGGGQNCFQIAVRLQFRLWHVARVGFIGNPRKNLRNNHTVVAKIFPRKIIIFELTRRTVIYGSVIFYPE